MSDEEEHSESEFYYPDELEFQDSSDLTETNYERVGKRENEGNSQEEIETFVKEQKSDNRKENSQRHENILTLFVIYKQGRCRSLGPTG